MIFNILQFKSSLDETDIIIEECGKENSKLNGYYIVLPRDRVNEMQLFLNSTFKEHEEVITEYLQTSDESEKERVLKQAVELFIQPNENYTDVLITKFGGIENLIKNAPSGCIGGLIDKDIENSEPFDLEDKTDEDYEEEDPEVIAELQKEIEDLSKEKEKLEVENDSLKEAQKSLDELKTLEGLKRFIPEDDLTDEIVGQFITILQQGDPARVRDALLNILINAGQEQNEIAATVFIAAFLEQFSA